MPKRILILAGTHYQIPVIEYARKQGHYVITCDNKPKNPGHKISDEYINISTTDLDGVLKLAREKRIDGILAYGSDPAAPTSAYVAEKLNLIGNNYQSILKLSDKGLFRKFLKDNAFPVPNYRTFKSFEEATSFYNSMRSNAFVKPVDSSGSKGVTMVSDSKDLKRAFKYAISLSRKGEVIIEEEIERKGPHIHGEAFVYKGEIIFILLGDQYFSTVNKCAPMSTTLPSICHSDIMNEITSRLSVILKLLNFKTGGLNIEIIRDKNDNLYFMEIGSRNGGNLMPELATLASGFNLAAANVNAALDEQIDLAYNPYPNSFFSQLILHSPRRGKFLGYNLEDQSSKFIRLRKEFIRRGKMVQVYRDSRFVIGVYILEFDSINICCQFQKLINQADLIQLE